MIECRAKGVQWSRYFRIPGTVNDLNDQIILQAY